MGQSSIALKPRALLWHEQVERSPLGTTFVTRCTPDEAREAIHRADQLVRQAELVRGLVRAQAAFALKDGGMSVRDIAGAVDISKSTIGRDLRHGHYAYDLDPDDAAKVVDDVRAAWDQ